MQDNVAALWGSPTFPRVLAILLEQPEREFAFAELVEGTGANRESVHRALRRGMDAHLVRRRPIGNQFVYSADLASPFYPEMKALAARSYGAQRLITDALREAGAPLVEIAFLFGSTASGRTEPTSDIDLMVIGTATRFDMARILRPVQDRLNRRINALAYPRDDVQRRLRNGDAFFLEVWSEAKLMLVGTEDDLPKLTETEVSWS
jgi:predicted nucleotidyltransferase